MKRGITVVAFTVASLLATGAAFAQTNPLDSSQPVGNRGTQSMNPDISVIVDGTGGFWQRRPLSLAGDDPDFGGSPSDRGGGATLQETELGLQSNIDPYLRGDVFLTIPNMQGLEIEEAYVTTTDLPADLQVRAGKFRSYISRENSQHLHMQDFTRRPLINQTFLGVDGLDAPGVEVNWLVPFSFYSTIYLEALSVSAPDDPLAPLQTFGGGPKGQLTGVASWRNFFPLGEEYSAYLGLDYGTGRSASAPGTSGLIPVGNNLVTQLYGADLYVKYKPANTVKGFHSFAWQTEYFRRHFVGDDVVRTQDDGGMYTQFVYQFAQRWYWGVRADFLGLPVSDFVKESQRYSTSLTFAPTEFSRIRAYVENEVLPEGSFPTFSPSSSMAYMMQFEVAMGAHGAHPF